MAEKPANPHRGSVVIFDGGETAESRLEGFTLSGGTGTSHIPPYYDGGGVLCINASSPTLLGCAIAGNVGSYGGGLYIGEGSSPALTDCSISGNWAPLGAGVYCRDSSMTMTNCTITENGGLEIDSFQRTINGGGVFCDESTGTLTNCTITGNSARFGGSLFLFPNASVTLTSCIVWNNPGSEGPGVAEVSASFSCIESEQVWQGEGNILSDPLFCSAGDVRLQTDSPCLGTGQGGIDMGALVGLCGDGEAVFVRGETNGDGTVNLADAVFLLQHLFASGEPPACMKSADANDNGGVDLTDGIFLLNSLFAGGGELPAPRGACGPDPTLDDLGCEASPGCDG